MHPPSFTTFSTSDDSSIHSSSSMGSRQSHPDSKTRVMRVSASKARKPDARISPASYYRHLDVCQDSGKRRMLFGPRFNKER
jgi:hypothetical protein